jgi:oxygen-dependent protoporphyrinogen oxidase
VPAPKNILVIGGGISGLACAWRLRQSGLPVLLLERSPRFGGVIDTVERNGFRFDVGPQSFSATQPLATLIDELGLGAELLRADPRAPRFILLKGRLVRAPLGPGQLLRTSLIGWPTKLRLFAEPFRHTHPPEGDESIAAFVRRKFGDDLLANLVAPVISGVFAGDPEKLSLASAFPSVHRLEADHGSVIRGALKLRRRGGGSRPPTSNFRKGMITLIEALAGKLGDAALHGVEITAIRRHAASDQAAFEVTYTDGGGRHSLEASSLVVATPTNQAARLLAEVEPRFGETLAKIEYASLAQVSMGFRLEQIAQRNAAGSLHGFGFLVPRGEHLRILGTVWNSSLFPGRAPETPHKMASFTSFVGGATDPEICAWSEDTIAETVRTELSSVLGIAGPPVAEHVVRWERALPQYNLGYARIVESLNALCAATPGVFLAGNYLTGPSLGACVEQANSVADAVARFSAAQD